MTESNVVDLNDRLRAGELPADPKQGTRAMNAAARAKLPAFERHGFLSLAQLLELVYHELKRERPERGLPTGIPDLDDAIGGYRRGNITVLGGKRSFGKTTFSIMAVDVAMSARARVLLFAGEDSAMMYGKRFLARRADINATKLRDLEVEPGQMGRVTTAVTSASREPFFVRTNGRPVEWIASAIGDVSKEHQIDLVIVDYLQCIRAGQRQQDRRNEVTFVTKKLVDAIRSANAAGLLLSQFKRTEKRRPEIEDLKESGDIEDMADHIILGFKQQPEDEHAPEERMIELVKNKDGPDDIEPMKVPFDPKTASFKPEVRSVPEEEQGPPDDWEERYP